MESLSLIKALVPAFAAGFAVQRLLEIADPLLDKAKNKKAILGVLSLIVGLALAVAGKLRVLLPLNTDIGPVLDYLVTGLFISAGTEGFNSILKFLSYKKEEKKAEAVEQKTSALNSLARSDVSSLGLRHDSAERVLSMNLEDFTPVDDQLKDALKAEIIKRWEDKFIEDGWEDRAFEDITNNLDAVRFAVRDATNKVAGDLGTSVPKNIMTKLQNMVGLDTTPGGILPQMRIAIG
jgi:hypothetical protein